MTLVRSTPVTAECGYVAELPACDHCAEPVVAVQEHFFWTWRHLSGWYRCGNHTGFMAHVAGCAQVADTIRITTDQRQED